MTHACQSTPEYSLEEITQSFWPPELRETGNHLPGKCYWGRHVKRSRYVPVATWLLFYGSQVREVQHLCVDFGGKSGVLLVIPQPSRGLLRYRGSQRSWPRGSGRSDGHLWEVPSDHLEGSEPAVVCKQFTLTTNLHKPHTDWRQWRLLACAQWSSFVYFLR